MFRKILYSFATVLFLITFTSEASAQNMTPSTTGSAKTTTEETTRLKQQIQLTQEKRLATLGATTDAQKALIVAKREEFKTRLQTIKDLKKRTLVEKIDTKIAEINKSTMQKYSDTLARIQEFLTKIKLTTMDATVLTDIANAQTAMDTAKIAISTQSVKTYTAELTDETMLKINVGVVVSQFRQDITAVYKLVADAKQSVQKLNTNREMIRNQATGSATQ